MPDDSNETSGLDDFAGAMQLLANQAAAKSSPGSAGGRNERNDILLAVGQMIRPLAKELEHLRAKNAEQSLLLTALGKSINGQGNVGTALEGMREQMSRLGSVESANQKLFDAMHTELKGYKDNFLFDALQKPFVRDLVSLFDDLSEVHAGLLRRLEAMQSNGNGKSNSHAGEEPAAAGGKDGGERKKDAKDKTVGGNGVVDEIAFLRTTVGNVENQLHHMIEVFLRMDVTISTTRTGAPVDKKAHRVVSFEPASLPAEDGLVLRSIKPGFLWRERHIRPEDVIARRWTPPPNPHAAPARMTALIASSPAKDIPETKLIPATGNDGAPADTARAS